jgi:predicted enzyme related to lactoylglutathione lyase
MANPVVHFEIGCRDMAKAKAFFGGLFSWKFTDAGPSLMIDTGVPGGITGHITSLGHEPFHYTNYYVQVDDLQATLDKVGQLGGKTLIPPTEVPNMGTFAWFTDPDGNTLGLWKPKAM